MSEIHKPSLNNEVVKEIKPLVRFFCQVKKTFFCILNQIMRLAFVACGRFNNGKNLGRHIPYPVDQCPTYNFININLRFKSYKSEVNN